MKTILTNLLLLFLIFFNAVSQTDYQRGYIIKPNGDTLHGFVDYQKPAVNQGVCSFKRFELALPIRYSPGKIIGYGILGGKQYKAISCNGKMVFAEFLTQGKYSLLFVLSNHYFVMAPNGSLVELKQNKMQDYAANRDYANYRAYLKSIFNNQELENTIDLSRLEIASMVEVFRQYYAASQDRGTIIERPRDKMFIADYALLNSNLFHIGLIGGAGKSILNPQIEDKSISYLGNAKYTEEINPIFGVFLEGKFTRHPSHFNYQLKMMYQKISFYGFAATKVSSYGSMNYDDIYIKAQRLRFSACVGYSLGIKSFNLVPRVGVMFSPQFGTSYSRFRTEFQASSNTVRSYVFTNVDLPKFIYGLNPGLTLEYRLSSAHSLQLNADYIYGEKLIENIPSDTYVSPKDSKISSSELLFTVGITL